MGGGGKVAGEIQTADKTLNTLLLKVAYPAAHRQAGHMNTAVQPHLALEGPQLD